MALLSDDLKTIAITSAIAAMGTAVATTLSDYLVTKYILKSQEGCEMGPQYVVVPVVGWEEIAAQLDVPSEEPPATDEPLTSGAVVGFGQSGEDHTVRNAVLAGVAGLAVGYLLAQ